MAVYFVRAGMSGPVKIGVADDVADRVEALQTAHYEHLTVLRVVAGDASIERAFHGRYSRLRIRGEWFHYSDDMLTADPVPMDDAAPRFNLKAPDLAADVATLDALRDKLCGSRPLAEAFGVEGDALKKWRIRGIPWRYRTRAAELLEGAA